MKQNCSLGTFDAIAHFNVGAKSVLDINKEMNMIYTKENGNRIQPRIVRHYRSMKDVKLGNRKRENPIKTMKKKEAFLNLDLFSLYMYNCYVII